MKINFMFAEIMGRLKTALGVDRDADLARVFCVDHRKFAVWKSRAFVPVDLIAIVCRDKGISINWVLFEQGQQHICYETKAPLSLEEKAELYEVQKNLLGLYLSKGELIKNASSPSGMAAKIETLKRASELLDRL